MRRFAAVGSDTHLRAQPFDVLKRKWEEQSL